MQLITTESCVHIGNVCDKSPFKCNCLILAIDCRNISSQYIKAEFQLLYLSVFISSSNIFSLHSLHNILKNAIVVKLTMNCIKEISELSQLQTILLIDLGFNCLKVVISNIFASLHLLQTLNLNDNHVTFFETDTFYNLFNLKYRNLSNNPLLNLPDGVFKQSLHLKIFYIVKVNLVEMNDKALHGLHVNVFITTDYHLCCISSQKTLCPTYKPWYISCSDIYQKAI